MTGFCPDLVRVRVSPVPAWRRYETTWDDIMDEIEERGQLEEITRRVTEAERELAATRRLIRECALLSLANQELLVQVMTNLDILVAKIAGRDD